jgi:hypothetical protein
MEYEFSKHLVGTSALQQQRPIENLTPRLRRDPLRRRGEQLSWFFAV